MFDYESRAKKIGQRIKEGRLQLGLSQQDFLDKIYMSSSSTGSLRAWEKGKRLPDLTSLARMAELFQCDIGYLLCDYDERIQDIADVCVYTGLSEEAVLSLMKLKYIVSEDGFLLRERGSLSRINILNLLITYDYYDDRFERILEFLQKALMIDHQYSLTHNNREATPEGPEQANAVMHTCSKVILNDRDAIDYYFYLAHCYFRAIIEDRHISSQSYEEYSLSRADVSTDKHAALIVKFIKDRRRENALLRSLLSNDLWFTRKNYIEKSKNTEHIHANKRVHVPCFCKLRSHEKSRYLLSPSTGSMSFEVFV